MMKKRMLLLILALFLLFAWGTPAYATGSMMGVQINNLVSYALDLNRIYQGGEYAVRLNIGENLSFQGKLHQGLPHDILMQCVERALTEEGLTRDSIIETNKMVAELTAKMKNPNDFWEKADFYAEALGIKHYTDTVKEMTASTMGEDQGIYEGLSARERQFILESLRNQSDGSFEKWKQDLINPGKVAKDKLENAAIKSAETALSTNVIGKVYKTLVGLGKVFVGSVEREDSFEKLEDEAMRRHLVVEAFYKRAGSYVKEYLDSYGHWQLRIEPSTITGGKLETMGKLNFDWNNIDGSFSTFYTINPIKITWTAEALLEKTDSEQNPNGIYTGSIKLVGEYDTSTLKSHLIPLVQKFEQYSLAQNMSMYDETKMNAFERSKPSVKQTWFVDQCQIEIIGLMESGSASVQLPELVLEKNITMDYELSGSYQQNMYGYTYTTTGYDELCTPEHITKTTGFDLPDTYNGEIMNWVVLNPLEYTTQGGAGAYAINDTYPAEWDENGYSYASAFIIRTPFDLFTGYKRFDISKE